MELLLQHIANWISTADKPVIIGVSGHGAAGKTTFANKLLETFNANYINTDPYIISSDIRKHTMIDYTYQKKKHRFKMTACHPGAHHLPSLTRDVQMVRDRLDFHTIDTDYMKSRLISSQVRTTIVEGMSVAFLNPDLFDLKIYFYTDGETEFNRRSSRDINERGMKMDYLKQSHNERRVQYEMFMHQYSRHFDVIINSSNTDTIIEKNAFTF